jgi:hypothetical protein
LHDSTVNDRTDVLAADASIKEHGMHTAQNLNRELVGPSNAGAGPRPAGAILPGSST